jgi:hypothetical protein
MEEFPCPRLWGAGEPELVLKPPGKTETSELGEVTSEFPDTDRAEIIDHESEIECDRIKENRVKAIGLP